VGGSATMCREAVCRIERGNTSTQQVPLKHYPADALSSKFVRVKSRQNNAPRRESKLRATPGTG